MNALSNALVKLGFLDDEQALMYMRQTGEKTVLLIEGKQIVNTSGQQEILYDFYKQTVYMYYPNTITVYIENANEVALLERVEKYLRNREYFLNRRR